MSKIKYKKMPPRKPGLTKWIDRSISPVRNGKYECLVRFMNQGPGMLLDLEWDGKGFLVPFPMIVDYWRGLTKAGSKQ